MKTRYISLELFNWDISISSSSLGNLSSIKRPYEIIAHSESLLNGKLSDFNLSDSIANLKRALNHRLQTIESNYDLKKLKYKGMPNGYLELLEEYGLAKPYVIKKLMEIRNNIEHNDAKPPRKDRCKELHDITWYFLKSTDRLIYYISNHFELSPNYKNNLPEKYECTIGLHHKTKKITLQGWVPLKYISKLKMDNSIEITCSTIHDGDFWKIKRPAYHKDKTKDDVWIIASLKAVESEKKAIFKKCFEAQ